MTEKATEIWVYDSYSEFTLNPCISFFFDYQGTGDYKLTTNVEISPFLLGQPTKDEPDIITYQIVGEIELDEIELEAPEIFDYDVSMDTIKGRDGSSVFIFIDIPYTGLSYRKEGNKYSCDLNISVEVGDSQKQLVTKEKALFFLTVSEESLKNLIKNKIKIRKEWGLGLTPWR